MGIVAWIGRAAAGAVTAGAALIASGALADPGAAAGLPTTHASRACYVNTTTVAPILVGGSGWTPGDTVQLQSRDGSLFGTTTVGASGRFLVSLTGVSAFGQAERSEHLTVTDQGNQTAGTPSNGQTATTSFLVANLAVTSRPSVAPLHRKVTFTFSGFRPGGYIYAHYLHRGAPVARQRFGRATGPCGILRTRALQYPGGHPRYAIYLVQVDDSARYSRRSTPRFVARLSTY